LLGSSTSAARPLFALLAAAGFFAGLIAGGALGAYLATSGLPWSPPTQGDIQQEKEPSKLRLAGGFTV
jgi:hypothetical protein